MARKRKAETPAPGSPAWMTTYGDLVTLLLCFFVLLFSFSSIDAQKFESIVESFQGSLGVLDGGETLEASPYIQDALLEELTTNQLEELEDFRKLQEMLEGFLEENHFDSDVLVTLETRGLVLRLQDNVLFDPGVAELKPAAREILNYLAQFLMEPEFEEKHIRIEGHTDTDPVKYTSRYATNWELSAARASAGVRYLIEEFNLDPRRFSASGYGEYYPVAPNDTAENKGKNRRIEIVILKSELVMELP